MGISERHGLITVLANTANRSCLPTPAIRILNLSPWVPGTDLAIAHFVRVCLRVQQCWLIVGVSWVLAAPVAPYVRDLLCPPPLHDILCGSVVAYIRAHYRQKRQS